MNNRLQEHLAGSYTQKEIALDNDEIFQPKDVIGTGQTVKAIQDFLSRQEQEDAIEKETRSLILSALNEIVKLQQEAQQDANIKIAFMTNFLSKSVHPIRDLLIDLANKLNRLPQENLSDDDKKIIKSLFDLADHTNKVLFKMDSEQRSRKKIKQKVRSLISAHDPVKSYSKLIFSKQTTDFLSRQFYLHGGTKAELDQLFDNENFPDDNQQAIRARLKKRNVEAQIDAQDAPVNAQGSQKTKKQEQQRKLEPKSSTKKLSEREAQALEELEKLISKAIQEILGARQHTEWEKLNIEEKDRLIARIRKDYSLLGKNTKHTLKLLHINTIQEKIKSMQYNAETFLNGAVIFTALGSSLFLFSLIVSRPDLALIAMPVMAGGGIMMPIHAHYQQKVTQLKLKFSAVSEFLERYPQIFF